MIDALDKKQIIKGIYNMPALTVNEQLEEAVKGTLQAVIKWLEDKEIFVKDGYFCLTNEDWEQLKRR